MPKTQRVAYAKVVQAEAKEHSIDPFTLVAIIDHESHWRAGAISADGEDYGLGQVRARFQRACRKDSDPVHNPSPACKRAKMTLLNGSYNIRRIAHHISAWRNTCRKITKRPALFHRWLAGYGGMGRQGPTGGWIRICGQRRTKKGWRDLPIHRQLRNIMNYRKKLIRLSKQRRR